MKNLLQFLFLIFVLFNFFYIQGQDTIYLVNPSFEDRPRKGGEFSDPIKGWHDCGLTIFPGESPPDIHPVPSSAWEVSEPPSDGKTYLGLVARYNDSWESVSQRLSAPLEGGHCYSLEADLCISKQYRSGTRRSKETLENFIQPLVLKVWAGSFFCEKTELLAESTPVDHQDWETYYLDLKPGKNFTYITIEAYYDIKNNRTAYNGHILVDNLSPIIEITCE